MAVRHSDPDVFCRGKNLNQNDRGYGQKAGSNVGTGTMKHFIIIGNSASGIAAVEGIRQRDKEAKITILSDEDYPSYCRCLISYYLAQEVKEDKLLYRPESFYKENNVEAFLNKKVVRVDPKKNRIICEDKTVLNYDALLIATGARPKFPDIAGSKKRGVFGFRTIQDARLIEGLIPVTKAACILGGGLIGLKAAYALHTRDVEVKVVVKSKQILSQMLDFEAAMFVQNRLQEKGISLILGSDVSEIIGEGDIKAVKLDSGRVFESSLVIVGKGVLPNIGLIKDTEIEFNQGIIVNEFQQTNCSNVYAAGDVCESFDITTGRRSVNALWPIAVEQGRISGLNMAGDKSKYEGSLGMNSLEFFGLAVVSLGDVCPADKDIEELKLCNEKQEQYKKLLLRNDILIGAVLVGDIRPSGVLLQLIRQRINVSSIKSLLLRENFSYPDIMDLVKDREKVYV